MKVETPRCVVCGRTGTVDVPDQEFDRWQRGELIQVALTSISVDDREQLLSGTHPACWETLEPAEEDR